MGCQSAPPLIFEELADKIAENKREKELLKLGVHPNNIFSIVKRNTQGEKNGNTKTCKDQNT